MLFVLRDVNANLSCALSSYQMEPTARDAPQNYIGIDALQTLSVVHVGRRLSEFELCSELISDGANRAKLKVV